MTIEEIRKCVPDGAQFIDNIGDYYKNELGGWYLWSKQVSRWQSISDIKPFFDVFSIKPL